jgi:hypothetical protein
MVIAFNRAAIILEIDSYRFWTLSSGILYNSSCRKSSCCFRDVGGRNLFLTLASRAIQWCSNLVTVPARENFNSSSCDWRHCRLGKLHSCSKMSGSWDACDCPTYVLPCSNSFMKNNNRTKRIHCTAILLPKQSPNLPRVSLLEPGIPDCRLPWVFSKRILFLM